MKIQLWVGIELKMDPVVGGFKLKMGGYIATKACL